MIAYIRGLSVKVTNIINNKKKDGHTTVILNFVEIMNLYQSIIILTAGKIEVAWRRYEMTNEF